ncbi:type I restriction endonuclease subunit S [Moraxella osloensis]|nr:type I restriction endonuclease subunit S [Moraxella osloensis]
MNIMRTYTIAEVCERFSSGKSIKASQIFENGDYPVFGGNGERGFTDTYNFEGECAIIGRQGAYCGNTRYFSGKAYMTEHAIVATTNENHNVGYVANLLSMMNLGQYQGQSAQPGLSVATLSKVEMRLPKKEVQDKIFQLLSTLDEKIALNNQINATLEQMAKTLYDYWFVQFDFPDDNGKPYKSSGGEMVYNETLKRDIPKGWDVKKLADWIKTDKSGDWGQEEPKGNYQLEVTCIRGADINPIKNQGIIEAPTRFILEKNANKLLSDFDFVIEISGGSPTQSTGRIASISPSTLCRFDKPLICSNFCKAISLKDNSYFYNFAFLWNQIYENDILFGWEGKTSGIKNLLFDNFVQSYYEPLPPVKIADKFFQKIDVINSQQQTLLKQNAELTKLRDWLLPMLMNGQVTVQ